MIDQRWTLAHPRPNRADLPKPLTASTNPRIFFATNALAALWKESSASLGGLLPAGGPTCKRPAFVAAWARTSASFARAHGHGLDRRAAQVLGPTVQSEAIRPRTFPDWSGSVRPLGPSSRSLGARFRADRIGGLTVIQVGSSQSRLDSHSAPIGDSTPMLPFAFNPVNAPLHLAKLDLINSVRRSKVTQDSDFRWKSRVRKKLGFSCVPPGVRRPPERLATARTVSKRQPEILNPVN